MTYRHQVRPSLGAWLFLVLIASGIGIATGAALGENVGWTLFFASAAMPAALLIKSTVTIEVIDGVLKVDNVTLPVTEIGEVRPLDKDAARRERGPALDPACHLVLRGWIPTAIMIENIDPDDPVPYWYVSTRDPEGLRDAIEASR